MWEHFFSASVDDLFDQFDENAITEAGKAFRTQYGIGSGSLGDRIRPTPPPVVAGESPTRGQLLHAAPALLSRYDWNGDGPGASVYMVEDGVSRTPICYDLGERLCARKRHTMPSLSDDGPFKSRKMWRPVGTGC